MLIQLEDHVKYICKKFACDVVDTNIDEYERRNQFDKDKIIDDIYVGKIAEFATYKLLKRRGKNVVEPDCQVYGSSKKSFSADLKDGSFEYHVKCMKASAARRFGLSWSFQKSDKLVTKPKANDIIVLCEYTDNCDVDIKALVKAKNMMELYTKPVLVRLQHIKCVLMWDDVYSHLTK
jgi:hypothetical protein